MITAGAAQTFELFTKLHVQHSQVLSAMTAAPASFALIPTRRRI
jgi:hypothetical protein